MLSSNQQRGDTRCGSQLTAPASFRFESCERNVKLCRRKFHQHSPEWAKVHTDHTHLCFFFPLHYLTLWLCFVSVLSQRGKVKERRHVTVSNKTAESISLVAPGKVKFNLNNRHPCGRWWTDVKQPSQTCTKPYKFGVQGLGNVRKMKHKPPSRNSRRFNSSIFPKSSLLTELDFPISTHDDTVCRLSW